MWMVYQVASVRTKETRYYVTNGDARELILTVLDVEDEESGSEQRIEWAKPLDSITDLYGMVEIWGDLAKISRELGQVD